MLKALRNQILVEKITKAAKQNAGIYIPETSHNVGLVYLVGPEVKGLTVGLKIYFGDKRESIRIGDKEVIVMEESNVYAVETNEEEATDSSKALE